MRRPRAKMYNKAVQTILAAMEEASSEMCDDFLDEVKKAEVVPYETGALEDSITIMKDPRTGIRTISHNSPYAQRLYYHPEFNFRRDRNRNAQGMWYDKWRKGDDPILKRNFVLMFKKKSRGYIE